MITICLNPGGAGPCAGAVQLLQGGGDESHFPGKETEAQRGKGGPPDHWLGGGGAGTSSLLDCQRWFLFSAVLTLVIHSLTLLSRCSLLSQPFSLSAYPWPVSFCLVVILAFLLFFSPMEAFTKWVLKCHRWALTGVLSHPGERARAVWDGSWAMAEPGGSTVRSPPGGHRGQHGAGGRKVAEPV